MLMWMANSVKEQSSSHASTLSLRRNQSCATISMRSLIESETARRASRRPVVRSVCSYDRPPHRPLAPTTIDLFRATHVRSMARSDLLGRKESLVPLVRCKHLCGPRCSL